MAQFDVYPNPSKVTKKYLPYLLDIQNPFLSDLSSRIVIPLGLKTALKNEALDRLTPEVSFEDAQLLILTPQMSSVPASILKNPIGTLSHFRSEIIGSLDFAISGI
ncbi:CcdB family protein [Gilvimarinus agarilyticus]|uniref:CcdB family protein n=1 Tax=Gilvimarinus sp. 2_MG-2023 TaxID=3062666 RepID=UPI001C09E467|nr:CcdB family protein [Gilvimarinus sp. 2_MG-2023]MBU2886096.1 CcdB family protein [Gilvimarinus agarilyticus]MDO6570806.1 CcdB family protein [Gilvimarinus sp. 2_MG-2023]